MTLLNSPAIAEMLAPTSVIPDKKHILRGKEKKRKETHISCIDFMTVV